MGRRTAGWAHARARSAGLLAALALAGTTLLPATTGVGAEPPGVVVAWGANATGQLGDGTHNQYSGRCQPLVINSLRDVSVIDAGDDTSLAATSSGTPWAWGWNPDGQLGTLVIGCRDYGLGAQWDVPQQMPV
jgi:hypothetical protein